MNILFIGDVFSSIGREMIERYLPILKEKYHIDIVIASVCGSKFIGRSLFVTVE